MVGVEPLNQLLEARLDVGLGGVVLEIELAQAFPLGALDRPLRLAAAAAFVGGAFGEQVERIDGREAMGEAARGRAPLRGLRCAPRD